jgi:hypothetical protein
MNRPTRKMRLALTALPLTALTLTGLTLLASAAQPPENLIPLKASTVGPNTPRFVIPLEPEIRLGTFTAEGEAALLGGPVTTVETNTVNMSVDGKVLSVTEGIAVLSAANGDALFLNFHGPATSATSGEFTFTVSGGRGRFLGATGSGVIHCTTQPEQKTVTRVIEGMVAIPK